MLKYLAWNVSWAAEWTSDGYLLEPFLGFLFAAVILVVGLNPSSWLGGFVALLHARSRSRSYFHSSGPLILTNMSRLLNGS